jgi:dihydrofolate reductase
MSRLTIDLSMSLDGYVAGPDPSLEDPLGVGGERLHEWAFAAQSWRGAHGRQGGEPGPDADVIQERLDAIGASIMGRKMYSGSEGPWEDDPRSRGWWGDDPPFHHPVFVLTHHAREPLEMEGGTTFHFVCDGIEAALEQARAAAGGKDVQVAGGAEAVQQFLRHADTIQIHVAPVLLGSGTRLFEGLGNPPGLEIDRAIASPAVTHIRYKVAS